MLARIVAARGPRLALVALCAIGLGACGLLKEEDQPVLMPLATGNTWTYTIAEEGQPIASTTYRVTREVREGIIALAEIEVVTEDFSGDVLSTDTIYARNEVGLTFYDSTGFDGGETAYYRYPIDSGAAYETPRGRVCATHGGAFDVPAGSFASLIFEPCDRPGTDLTVFAPQVGIIFSGNFARRSMLLASYELQRDGAPIASE